MTEAPAPGTAIARPAKRQPAIREWDNDFARLVKTTILKPKDREATNAELALFAEQVQRTGLDPFLGQIYGIYRYDGRAGGQVMQVQVGIDGFRLTAERTGKYEGQTKAEWCNADGVWADVWLSDEHPAAARIGVYKTGRREPTYAVAHWKEYAQKDRNGKLTGQWGPMPANQIAKCAEALALRKCFPAELSGLHIPEEMGHVENPSPEIVDAMPIEEERPDEGLIDVTLRMAADVLMRKLWTNNELNKHLVAHGATDTDTIDAALATMTADGVQQFIADMEAALAKPEEPKS